MSQWFRVYDEILDDPKVQLLSPELFKTWINLLAVASRNNGMLPPLRELAFSLRLSAEDIQSRLDDLILVGLIDILPGEILAPHNWSKRQWKSDDSTERVRRHRAKKAQANENAGKPEAKRNCNADVTVTVTPPESEAETETESKGLPLTPSCGPASDPPPDAPDAEPTNRQPRVDVVEAFNAWNEMANRIGLPMALKLTDSRAKALRARLREHGAESWKTALAAVERSEFLRGEGGRGWRADLDFVLQPSKFVKLIEGGYSHETRSPAPRHPSGPLARKFETPEQRQKRREREEKYHQMYAELRFQDNPALAIKYEETPPGSGGPLQ